MPTTTLSFQPNVRDRRRPRAALWRAAVLALLALVMGCASNPQTERERQRMEQQQATLEQAKAAYETKDYKQAITLLRPLAVRGNTDAQYALGYMIYYGKGMPRDDRRALRWITLAAQKGHPKAIEALRRFSSAIRKENGDAPSPSTE